MYLSYCECQYSVGNCFVSWSVVLWTKSLTRGINLVRKLVCRWSWFENWGVMGVLGQNVSRQTRTHDIGAGRLGAAVWAHDRLGAGRLGAAFMPEEIRFCRHYHYFINPA